MPSQPSFWMPGRPDRNLSVTSLPSPVLRNLLPEISRISGFTVQCLAVRFEALNAEACAFHIVNLAEVVVQAFDEHPQTVRA